VQACFDASGELQKLTPDDAMNNQIYALLKEKLDLDELVGTVSFPFLFRSSPSILGKFLMTNACVPSHVSFAEDTDDGKENEGGSDEECSEGSDGEESDTDTDEEVEELNKASEREHLKLKRMVAPRLAGPTPLLSKTEREAMKQKLTADIIRLEKEQQQQQQQQLLRDSNQ